MYVYTINDKSQARESFAIHWISFKCIKKTFVVFASSALKVLPLLKAIVGRTFAIHLKSGANNSKAFFLRSFCHLRYMLKNRKGKS